MVKRIAAFWMMGQLLLGSIALPLGDYSMIKELPRMYQAYEKVVSPDEKGILDFIGDYVLNGKDLLGHNQHDQPSKPGALQFQGSPFFAVTLQPSLTLTQPLLLSSSTKPSRHHFSTALSDYHSSLFRPPLA
jgi:hypothetical protein